MRSRSATPVLRVIASEGAPPPAVTDADVLEAFRSGNRKAAGLLYDHLVGVVDSTLYRVVGRRESDHDDLVQATFEQIIVTLTRKSFAGGCSLGGWAASIACHVGLNAIRSRTRARRVFAPEGPAGTAIEARPSSDDVEATVAARRDVERLRAALATMDSGRATTVIVHDVVGLGLAETARLQGISQAAAQSRLVRGRRELKEKLSEEQDP